MIRNNPFRNGVSLKLPRYTVNKSEKRKSCFIDRNSTPSIKKDLGFFDYDSLQYDERSSQNVSATTPWV